MNKRHDKSLNRFVYLENVNIKGIFWYIYVLGLFWDEIFTSHGVSYIDQGNL